MSVSTRTVTHEDHVVRFYDSDDEIVGLLAGYITAAVRDDETAVAITTRTHQDAIIAELIIAEVDVVTAAATGHLVLIEAEEGLARFTVDGQVDAARFQATIGGVIASAVARGKPVRACGEMVGLLWQAGDVLGAIELERLWNELLAQAPASLLCTYPSDAQQGSYVDEVCVAHARVVAAPPAAPDAEVLKWFAASTHAPRAVRQFVASTLHDWGRSDVDDALLVASELATNAVRHARSDFTVALSRVDDDVVIAVGDADDNAPHERASDALATGGRGLPLVDGTTVTWGHHRDGAGKVVWARVAASAGTS